MIRWVSIGVGAFLALAVFEQWLEPISALFWLIVLLLVAQGFLPTVLESLLKNRLDTKLAEHTHELDKKLDQHRLELNSALAHYTARTGLLSEAQLKATQEIWGKLFRVQWDVVRRASPLQSVRVGPGIPDPDALREEYFRQAREELVKLDEARVRLLESIHEQRPFLPEALFEQMTGYGKLLLDAVLLLLEHIEEGEPSPQPGEDRGAVVARRRAFRLRQEELLKQLDESHNKIADEIRNLTSPPPPAPPGP